MVFEIFTLFHFPQKSKMAAKSGKNGKFSPLHRTLLYYPGGLNFVRNRSLTVFEIFTLFRFLQKSKMAAKSGKMENFPPCIGHSCTTLGVKNSLKIALYLLPFSRYSHFFIFLKNPRWPPKVAKMKNFPLCIGHSCTTLGVENSLEIALSLTVFEIFTLFHFSQKSKMAATISGENGKFSPLYKTLLYYPGGQKFARNRSISYGF